MHDSQADWVRQNKRKIIEQIINKSGAQSDGNPSAIFMAGLPGAGKTEFTKNLISISDSRFVRIDMDEIAAQIQGYEPQKADEFRKDATKILNEVFADVLKRKLDFIMDGTFGSRYASLNIERAYNHGYRSRIIYIYQDPKIAWQYTLAREKIEYRAIKIDGFIDTYFNTISNICKIMKQKHDIITLDFVSKDSENKIKYWLQDVNVDEFIEKLNNNYDKESLREYIND